MSEWDKRYRSKIKEGYIDKSEDVEDTIVEIPSDADRKFKEIENENVKKFVDILQDLAAKTIQKNYQVTSSVVTQKMVDKAQKQIDDLATNVSKYTLKKFNEGLIQLFYTIPRNMKNVNEEIAKTKDDFGVIIQREQDLLDVMKGQVFKPLPKISVDNNSEPTETILEANGIVIEEATEKDIEIVKKLLGKDAKRLKNVYCATNLKTQARFDEYVKEQKFKKKDLKLFFHGSKNENWWSIFVNGLNIRPANAASNGRMLGHGSYFANDINKSITYSSISTYSYKKEKFGFFGIFETGYGTPYDINKYDSSLSNLTQEKLQKIKPDATCLHAHRGMNTGWRNLSYDEIIFYLEKMYTIKYIIELE